VQEDEMNLNSKTKLNNGVEIPWVGLGVFQSEPGPETEHAVRWALDIGYRHIDTASFYKNEESVGKALASTSVSRDDIFVTTKVWNDQQGYEKTLTAFDESRKKLGLDVVDLYLVHWPIAETRLETWKALTKLYEEKKVRAIGVSNFMKAHLKEIMENSDVVPAVNQVEFHPFLLQPELLSFDNSNEIQHEAWSPLTRTKLWNNSVIDSIAKRHERSRAQILLRWDLQKGVVTIPKSVNHDRIKENSEIFDFELSEEEVAQLDGLDRSERIGPDPDEMASR